MGESRALVNSLKAYPITSLTRGWTTCLPSMMALPHLQQRVPMFLLDPSEANSGIQGD